jgi:hypothetical protein
VPSNANTEQTALELREQKRRAEGPVTLADGGSRVFDLRGNRGLQIVAGAGATVTYSKVDTADAEAHDAATDATIAAGAEGFVEKWAFIRVSTTGGSCRCCVV